MMLFSPVLGLAGGVLGGLFLGLFLGMRNGGWFVLLQKDAHRHLVKAGNLPPHPANFLDWAIERQIFRRIGGGVRFRHSLIQQYIANSAEGALPGRGRVEYKEYPLTSSSGLIQLGGLAAIVSSTIFIYNILYMLLPTHSSFRYTNLSGTPSDGLLLTAVILETMGLIGFYVYAHRINTVRILGLTAFVIALCGEIGMFVVQLFDAYQVPSTYEVSTYSFAVWNLGWLLLGVSFLRARLYSRRAVILLIATSSLLIITQLIELLIASLNPSTLLNPSALLVALYLFYSFGGTLLFPILSNLSIAWLGVVLWTGKNVPVESST